MLERACALQVEAHQKVIWLLTKCVGRRVRGTVCSGLVQKGTKGEAAQSHEHQTRALKRDATVFAKMTQSIDARATNIRQIMPFTPS